MERVERLTISSIAAGGSGVGRAGGLVVFVPRTAPGDVIDAEVELRGRFAHGRMVRLVTPGPGRVEPRCRHYLADRCGGCQLQHLDYATQLEARSGIVRDALHRIGRRQVDAPPVTPSPSPWAYRSKLTLTLRHRAGAWTIGLHAYDDPDHVFDLHECPITDPAVVQAWHEIRAAASLLPRARQLRGAVRRLGSTLAFVVEGARKWDTAGEFARRCPTVSLVRWHPEGAAPRVVIDRRTGHEPAASFEQVNPAVAALLRERVVDRALADGSETVVDAYAGSGATAGMLAGRGARVTAIEVDAEAAAYAARVLPSTVRVVPARVEDVLDGVLPADVVILNPPRAGVDRRVTEALQRQPRPRRVLYVSCNPATLARDLTRLPAFRITHLELFDMFPQTAHIETVCELMPEAA